MKIPPFIIDFLIPMIRTAGKQETARQLDKLAVNQPNWHCTAIICGYRIAKVHVTELVERTDVDWDNKANEDLLEVLEEQADKHNIPLPDVTVKALPAPDPVD